MYIAGQIIDRKEHIAFANWKNANGGTLKNILEKRAERDNLLAQTDKYMLSDFPITDEKREQYKAYRKYLRDLPEQESFPNVEIMTFEKYVESITQGE